MSKHFPFMNELKALPSKEDFDPTDKHKVDMMKALVHGADIGNPTRSFDMCKIWAMKILKEFFS